MFAARRSSISEWEIFLDEFRDTLSAATPRLLAITEEQSEVPRAEDKWSAKQIIGHLIDSAGNNHQRFVRAQFIDDLIFPGYEQNEWVRVEHFQEELWRDLVQFWQLYNQHILHIMKHATEDTRTKLRQRHNLHQLASEQIREDEPVTLEFFMRDYVDHMKKHLGQVFGN
ncbi:MAG: DinB family protein [Pyrinomonadaceae bacterium]